MQCPTLSALPAPEASKAGWPWTVESDKLPSIGVKGASWPRISIVTPSFNQGRYLEATIRSVLLQGYPNIEFIIMDGGSSDDSVAIIKKYEKWISHWVSEKDGGQCAAINKGMSLVTGEFCAWINSDDGYLPSAFERVVKAFDHDNSDIVVGNSVYRRDHETFYVQTAPLRKLYIDRPGVIPQHATFWRTSIHEVLDERLHCALDTELWLRLFPKAGRISQIPYAVAYVNIHPDQKTSASAWDLARNRDQEIIQSKHPPKWWHRNLPKRIIDYAVRLDHELAKMRWPSLDVLEVSEALNTYRMVDESEAKFGSWVLQKIVRS